MEPISLVTLKSRRCARLPPWRPQAPRASQWPCQLPLFLPGDWSTLRSGLRTGLGFPQLGAGLGGTAFPPPPEHPWAGAVRRAQQAEQSLGAGAGRGLASPPPQHGRVLQGPSDQDVARPGSSPARTQGPGSGPQLPPVLRTRPPTEARTLVRGRTGKCALFSPASQVWWV